MKANKIGPLKNHHINDEMVALYADALSEGQLPDIPMKELQHVESCRQCKDKILDLSIFLRNPDTISHIQPNEDLPPRKIPHMRFRYMPIAALFFIGILVIGAYFLLFNNDETNMKRVALTQAEEKVLAKADKEPTAYQKRDLNIPVVKKSAKTNSGKINNRVTKANFKVNPNLESMINSHYRSEGIEIIAPKNNTVIKEPITFAWKETTYSSLILKIINNQNQVFHHHEVKGNSYTFQPKLNPGLYYWKLENKNDLLFIGKFIIR